MDHRVRCTFAAVHIRSDIYISGVFADFFTVACRTDKGLTVFLVERGEGVETKQIKTSCASIDRLLPHAV
jgi:hypothetical protein